MIFCLHASFNCNLIFVSFGVQDEATIAKEILASEPWMTPTPEIDPSHVKAQLKLWARNVADVVRQPG